MMVLRVHVLALIMTLVCIARPAQAQRVAQNVLEERSIVLRETIDNNAISCLGFRLRTDSGHAIDIVVTAGHCLRDLRNATNWRLDVTSYDGTASGVARWCEWWGNPDVGLCLVTPSLGYMGAMSVYDTDPREKTEILSMISIGGGRPTPAIGFTLKSDGDGVHTIMPGGPGSSGGAVVDMQGRLLGMIVSGLGYKSSAGYYTNLVAASRIALLIENDLGRIVTKATALVGERVCVDGLIDYYLSPDYLSRSTPLVCGPNP